MKKTLAALLSLSLVFTLVLTACGDSGNGGSTSSDNSPVVATLGDAEVTLDEYTFFYRYFQNSYEYQALFGGYSEDDMLEFWNSSQGDILIKDMLAQEAMASAKEYRLLYNAALEKGTTADAEANADSDQQVDAMLEELDNDPDRFLEEYKFTPELVKEMYYRFDLVNQFYNQVIEEIEVTDEEVQAAYDADRNAYSTVTVRHILFSFENHEKEEALELAEDILAQLEGGGDIGALAAEHSEDPGSASNNGEYTFGRGEMVEPFEEWSFNAQPGEHGIVETSYGYHVMEMIGHTDFASIQEEVREAIRYEKANDIWNEIIEPAYADGWEYNESLISTLDVEQDLLDAGATPAAGNDGDTDADSQDSDDEDQDEAE